MDWNSAGLRASNFEGFVTFAELPDSDVPEAPGVYVVLRERADAPAFLGASVAGMFKGRTPSVSVERLEGKWVDDVPVLYIGKATQGSTSRRGLRKRLNEYRRIGNGEPVGHWGGRFIWQLADHADLTVAWKVVDGESPTDVEDSLIRDFVSQYGSLPFANLRYERKGARTEIVVPA
ncbi:hypothetical protein [Georgenia faecalis]|uniref:hypothetical protein n=1 Tax=Georgenia faecalis TaxID=2483799 RepID=UPI000FD94BCD|nr:hypothetical protein [Georgenia faecalis]